MRRIWSGLITARVTRFAQHVIDEGGEVDDRIAAHDGPRLEVSEAVARAAEGYGISLPLSDESMRVALEDRGAARPVNLDVSGLIVWLPDGRAGFSLGGGRTVESRGDQLCVITEPTAGRYAAAHALPEVTYLGGAR